MDKFVLNGEITPDYEDNNCMLFNYDCLEVLKELPNESIDLIVSDVPYHIVIGSRCSKKQGYPAKNQGKLFEYDSIKFVRTQIFAQNLCKFLQPLPEGLVYCLLS